MLPLNFAQRRNLYGTAPRDVYTVQVSIATPQRLRVNEVEQAIWRLLSTHEALRSRLVYAPSGTPYQHVADMDESKDRCQIRIREVPGEQHLKSAVAQVGTGPVDPRHHSVRCVLFTVQYRVRHVVLNVSHLFADGISQQVISEDLTSLLTGEAILSADERRQASSYSGDVLASITDRNTSLSMNALATAPRSCTYTGRVRSEFEEVQVARSILSDGFPDLLVRTGEMLGVSPYMLWAAGLSLLVGTYTGNHRHVFRSITANRFTPADENVVASLAQPVYVPVDGSSDDTLRERVELICEAVALAHTRGICDTGHVLEWLDQRQNRRGAAFRPAFDLNYLIHENTMFTAATAEGGESHERRKVTPHRATSDLAVQILQKDAIHLCVTAGEPVWAGRHAGGILDDLVIIVNKVCTEPDLSVESIPVMPLPGSGELIRGHVSEVGVDLPAMRELLCSHPDVIDGIPVSVPDGSERMRLCATVKVRSPVDTEDLLCHYIDKQRWISGSIVPDELSIELIGQGLK